MSGSLIAALEVLQQGDMAAVGAAVASLAWQQLQGLPTSLLWDLAWLVQDGLEQQDEQQVQLYGGLLRHYVQVGPCYEHGSRLMLLLMMVCTAHCMATAAAVPQQCMHILLTFVPAVWL